ncbi:sulfurtransferase TusA family protein [Phaeobacter sp. LSS9]|uniref:sulfurtransferase TusA family protein n=1 Tax=unclassified Phaeobacter TaxID=2621772 RepID=UPI0020C7C352|nr:sulfurtransferase TusA family protein [Phaeobacter sp. LSS9]
MKQPDYLQGMTNENEILDALGLLCPLPVLKARKRLKPLASGRVLEVHADDPAAVVDIPHFCHEAGHELLEIRDNPQHQIYLIRKGG